MTKCAYQLDACAQDLSCSSSLECASTCRTTLRTCSLSTRHSLGHSFAHLQSAATPSTPPASRAAPTRRTFEQLCALKMSVTLTLNNRSCNGAFKNMTSCAAQCLPDAPAQVLDLIAEDEHELRIMSKCNIIKKAECAVGVAAAISSCGGPANIPCIISRLKALHGCGKWYLLLSPSFHNSFHGRSSTPFQSTASARPSSAGACARTSAKRPPSCGPTPVNM
jgi:hypothetical protein